MFVSKLRSSAVGLALAASLAASSCGSCRRTGVPEATYREAVTAFHTALAALETSQEPLARAEARSGRRARPAGAGRLGQPRAAPPAPAGERAGQGAPDEGRGAGAAERGHRAAAGHRREPRRQLRRVDPALAARRRARAGRRQGGLRAGAGDRAAGHARERRRGAARARDAARHQRQPAGAPRRDPPRRQARRRRRGEQGPRRAGAPRAVVAGRRRRRQLDALRQAAATNPRAAATRVLFLKNVLVREPAYRRALAQVSTPLDAVGEPIEQFLVLPNPAPGAAPAGHRAPVLGHAEAVRRRRRRDVGRRDRRERRGCAGRRRRRRRAASGSAGSRSPRCQARSRRRSAPTRCWRRISTTTSAPTSSSPRAPASLFLRQGADGRFTDVTQRHDAAGVDHRCTGPRGVGRRRRHRRRSRRRAGAGAGDRRAIAAAQQRRRHLRGAAAVRRRARA